MKTNHLFKDTHRRIESAWSVCTCESVWLLLLFHFQCQNSSGEKKGTFQHFFPLCNSDKAAILTATIHCICILQMIYIITQQVDLKVYQAHRVALCQWFVPNQWPLITKFAEEFIVGIYSVLYCNTVIRLVKYYPPERGLRGLKENTCNSPATIYCSISTFTSLQPSICPNNPQMCWGKRMSLLLPIKLRPFSSQIVKNKQV